MSRWLNRFVSCATVLLAACQGAPRVDTAPRPQAATVAVQTPSSGPASRGASGSANPAGPMPNAPVPDAAVQHYAAALQLAKAGRTTDAELELKQLAVAYPDLAGPRVTLGILYLAAARLAEAEAAFKSALERNPANAAAGNELGIALRKEGKFTEAEAAYQRTIAADPNYAPAYLNLGVLYDLYLAEPQKALEQYEHYLRIAGDNKQVAGWVVELRKRVGVGAPAAKKEQS